MGDSPYDTRSRPNRKASHKRCSSLAIFIDDSGVALALGDNLFFGQGLSQLLREAAQRQHKATIFAYRVNRPERYGVVTLDEDGKACSIVEKPAKPTVTVGRDRALLF